MKNLVIAALLLVIVYCEIAISNQNSKIKVLQDQIQSYQKQK